MTEPFTFTAPITFTAERINDLLCCAFEGGSNYWMGEWRRDNPQGEKVEYGYELATTATGAVIVVDYEVDPEDPDGNEYRLDRAAIQRGLDLLKDWPSVLAEIIEERDDADTGDSFLQLCLFGDVIYG